MATNHHRTRTVAILGAGCAGTLLAAELCRQRYAGRVELFDARTDFTREQRWCFWRGRGEKMPGLPIDTEWSAWQVTDKHRTVRQAASSYVYSHVYAPKFFRRFHDQLADDPRVALRLGSLVLAIHKHHRGGHRVRTSDGEVVVDAVIDARHEGAPAYQRATVNAPGLLWQTFRGRVVQSAGRQFDPAAVNLMDFRVPIGGAGLVFAYMLPFSATHALVEAVVIDQARASAARLDSILDAYLEQRHGGRGETLAVEEGALPMTNRAFVSPAGGLLGLGVGGGAARPSSGYAFANAMRDATRTAAALCAGQPLQQPRLALKYRYLDGLFLRLLGSDPAAARRAFMAMFAGVKPDRLVRFLSERSSWRDDLALGSALPKMVFFKTMIPSLVSEMHGAFGTRTVEDQATTIESLVSDS